MKKFVKKIYQEAIEKASKKTSCCTSGNLPDSSCCTTNISTYAQMLQGLPIELEGTSFGCGYPLMFTSIKSGQTILDLGCGAGLEVIVAALSLGTNGKVIGLDFTEKMLQKASNNLQSTKLKNAHFVLGEIESLPFSNESVDLVITNCVLNLVSNKEKAFQEIYRLLKPGGELVISDIVSEKEIPKKIKDDPELWASCIGGAILEQDYLNLIKKVGFSGTLIVSRQKIETQGITLFSVTLKALKPDPSSSYNMPLLTLKKKGKKTVIVEPNMPAWFVTNSLGSKIIKEFRRGEPLSKFVSQVKKKFSLSNNQIIDFTSQLQLMKIISSENSSYKGRFSLIQPELKEVWFHLNNSCNFQCKHCLVNARKKDSYLLSKESIKKVLKESNSMGTHQFLFTGGEPFLRKDIIDLIKLTLDYGRLVLFSNGSLFNDSLNKLPKDNLFFQISLEGHEAQVNDVIRGKGTFSKTIEGINKLLGAGFPLTIATTLTKVNAPFFSQINQFLRKIGICSQHIHLLHPRGRARLNHALFLSPKEIVKVMKQLRKTSKETGVVVDNFQGFEVRMCKPAGYKFDLCQAGYETIAIDPDGQVYPCAAFVGDKRFICGSIKEKNLKDIWNESPILTQIRQLSLLANEQCRNCKIKFYCGGGCLSYKYYSTGKLEGNDLYCYFYQSLFDNLAEEFMVNNGGNLKIYSGMLPLKKETVSTFHCNCALLT